jgi:hypothetical protein
VFTNPTIQIVEKVIRLTDLNAIAIKSFHNQWKNFKAHNKAFDHIANIDPAIRVSIPTQLTLAGYPNPDTWQNDDFDNVMSYLYRSLNTAGKQDGQTLDQIKEIPLKWSDPRVTDPITQWTVKINPVMENCEESEKKTHPYKKCWQRPNLK